MKYLILLFLFFLKLLCFSQIQNDSIAHSNSVRLNFLGIAFKSLTLFVDQRINEKNYFEFTVGYQKSFKSIGNKIMFFSDNDPFWYYSRTKCGLGFNHYFSKQLYLGSYIQYRYSYYDKILFEKYINEEGDIGDEDWLISRQKQELGIFIKMGILNRITKYFVFEFYIGLGVRKIFTNVNVWARTGFNGLLPNDYPLKTNDEKYSSDILIGISLGLYK